MCGPTGDSKFNKFFIPGITLKLETDLRIGLIIADITQTTENQFDRLRRDSGMAPRYYRIAEHHAIFRQDLFIQKQQNASVVTGMQDSSSRGIHLGQTPQQDVGVQNQSESGR